MAKKSNRNTRGRIVSAAWKLFYEQGYEDTTVEEIIELSGTSKGSFYHYFDGKDALLSTLSSLFDEKYEELTGLLTPEMTAMEQLLFLNRELFHMIEDSISLDLLARLYSTQLPLLHHTACFPLYLHLHGDLATSACPISFFVSWLLKRKRNWCFPAGSQLYGY